MSSFALSSAHVSAMLSITRTDREASYYFKGQRVEFAGNKQEIGQILIDQNHASVNIGLEPDEIGPAPLFRIMPEAHYRFEPVEVLRMIHCYEYQSGDTVLPDWETSRAKAIVEALKDLAIRALPGYDDAPFAYKS